MIIVPVKDGENIERALKKFKRKFEKTGVVKELRARQQYNKPSVCGIIRQATNAATDRMDQEVYFPFRHIIIYT